MYTRTAGEACRGTATGRKISIVRKWSRVHKILMTQAYQMDPFHFQITLHTNSIIPIHYVLPAHALCKIHSHKQMVKLVQPKEKKISQL